MTSIMGAVTLILLYKTKNLLITESMILTGMIFLKYLYLSWDFPLFFSMSMFVDKISTTLIILSFWVSCLMIQTTNDKDNYNNIYKLMIILLNVLLLLLFSTTNLIMFFTYFEISLIPTLFMIVGWGYQPERLQATMYMMMYTMLFSLPFFSVVIFLKKNHIMIPLFNYDNNLMINKSLLDYLIMVMYMIFLVKIPMFFFHFWLPKAHVQAPLAGSMILASLLLKMGGYGIIRIFYFYNSMLYLFCSIASVGMVLICMVCLLTTDTKKIIAYSSINHMNFMISGLMLFNMCSVSGSVMMMLSHGLTSSGMFFLADLSYKRFNSRSLFMQKSMCVLQPIVTLLWFIMIVMNMGLPPSMSSMSEIMLSLCLIKTIPMMQILIIMYLFFSAFYSIYLYFMLNHGINEENQSFFPINMKEMMIVFFHIFPLTMVIMFADYLT